MFQKARLKLTGWYLLILALIVVSFSATIYRLVNNEITRVANAQRNRIERWQIMVPPADFPTIIFFDDEEVMQLRQRLIGMLLTVDSIIVVIAGGMSYILAGKTLAPIEEMVTKQEQFVADSSHELRTPLTALRTSMEVALRDKSLISGAAKELIKENLTEVIRLQSLAENLLELTRSGKPLTLTEVNLAQLVAQAKEQVSQLAARKKIEIKTPKTNLRAIAHSLALERVMVIILDNAIKYSAEEMVVKVSASRVGQEAVITITDQGIGIPRNQINKVFERFYRGDSARSNAIPGYGLGLAIAYELMKAQNGTIAIESVKNKGTIVKLRLPISA